MDLKKLLQVIDSCDKPAKKNSQLTEGTSLSVRMAMQQYQNTDIAAKPKNSITKKYIKLIENENAVVKQNKLAKTHEHAKAIVNRIKLREDDNYSQSTEVNDSIDSVRMDVPLLIRLLEYAKEDAETDMDLHNVADKLIEFSKEYDVLTMDQYDAIVGEQKALPSPPEQ